MLTAQTQKRQGKEFPRVFMKSTGHRQFIWELFAQKASHSRGLLPFLCLKGVWWESLNGEIPRTHTNSKSRPKPIEAT